MLKKELMTTEALTPPEGGIHFKTSKAMNWVDFFDSFPDPNFDVSFLQVYINNKLTDIPANALTADAGDDIRIVSLSDPSKPYPFFYPSGKDYIAPIEEPLPFMDNADFSYYFENCGSLVSIPENLFINNPQITNFSYCFYHCKTLTSIPEGLFDNNSNATNFTYCFSDCTSLTSIPEGLFDNNSNATNFTSCFDSCTSLISIPEELFNNNPNATNFMACFRDCRALTSIPQGLFDNNLNATNFRYCFRDCRALTSIPDGLFDNNPNVTDFNNCFYNCTSLISIPLGLFDKNLNVIHFGQCFEYCENLTVNVQIGSTTTSSVNVYNFARGTAAKGTVYCRAGSKAYNAFLASTSANVNVLTY